MYFAKPTGQPEPRPRAVVFFPSEPRVLIPWASPLALVLAPYACSRPAGLARNQEKMERHCSIESKFPTGSKLSISSRSKFDNFSAEKERASFGRTTGRKGQKGAPLEVDHVGRKISLEPKLSIKFLTEISEIFGIMKSTPDAVFHPTSRQSEVCLQGSVNVTTIVPRNFRVITLGA